jgi:hypothetical protein
MSLDGLTVENTIVLPPGATTWAGATLIPLSDVPGFHDVSVQIGDVLSDSKTSTFIRQPVDPQKLADAKSAALAHVDAVDAKIRSIADGSLKAQIAAATDLDTLEAARADVSAVDASLEIETK